MNCIYSITNSKKVYNFKRKFWFLTPPYKFMLTKYKIKIYPFKKCNSKFIQYSIAINSFIHLQIIYIFLFLINLKKKSHLFIQF